MTHSDVRLDKQFKAVILEAVKTTQMYHDHCGSITNTCKCLSQCFEQTETFAWLPLKIW